MFRLRFWTLLLSLSVLTVAAGEARLAFYRVRELRLNPPIIASREPNRHSGRALAGEQTFRRTQATRTSRGYRGYQRQAP